jgi:PAS domain S-box-containing protein
MSVTDPKRILLVEDEAIIALGQKARLEKYGYHVEVVNTGEKAVGKMLENPAIDLILMDINLGDGMDGTEAAEAILKTRHIPIVFLSSHTEPEIVEKTESITSYGYVVKDTGPTVLDASIKMAFKLFAANRRLRKSENRLEDIIFSSSDWVWEVDRDGVYTYSSQKGTDILGRSLEEIIGKTPFDFMAPDEALRVSGILGGIMERKVPIKDLENWNVGKAGERICLLTNGVPVLDMDGNLSGYRGIDKDITERKLDEEKLAIIKNAVEATGDAIGISDAEGRHFYQNKALSELFGYADAEDLQAAGGGPAVVKDPAVATQMFADIKCGKPWAGELEMVTKGGRTFPAFERADAIKDGEGRVIGLIGIINDMTERKRAADRLRRSEERLRNVLAGTKAGTWEWNIQTGDDILDEESASLLGYSLAELKPDTYEAWMGLKHPDDRERAQDLLDKHLRGETELYSFESRARHKNGGWVWILGRGKVIERDGEGKPLRMFGTYIDITEHKLAEEALRTGGPRHSSAP